MSPPATVLTSRAEVIISVLAAAGWDDAQESGYPLYAGPEILDDPDQAVFITIAPGPGYLTEEGGVDSWGFQARVRGPSDDPDAAAVAAEQLDWLILTASYPVTDPVSGVRVLHAHRSGGHPVPLPLDPQDRRFEYTCTYLFVTGA